MEIVHFGVKQLAQRMIRQQSFQGFKQGVPSQYEADDRLDFRFLDGAQEFLVAWIFQGGGFSMTICFPA